MVLGSKQDLKEDRLIASGGLIKGVEVQLQGLWVGGLTVV